MLLHSQNALHTIERRQFKLIKIDQVLNVLRDIDDWETEIRYASRSQNNINLGDVSI